MIKIVGLNGFYDLSSGYLGENSIGRYIKSPIYSKEKLLMDIECLCFIKNVTIELEAYDLEESEIRKKKEFA